MSTLNIYFKKGYREGIKMAKVETVRNLLLAKKYTIAEIGNFIKVTEALCAR